MFLKHTHSVPLAEVMRDLRSWYPALLEEFNSILTIHKAIRPVTKDELKMLEKQGREILYVPGKLVATVKAGTGKQKARIVACGNFLGREKQQRSPTLSRGDIFAAGLDSLALRAQIAAAAWRGWGGYTVDIKTAFLTAPLQAKRSQRVVVLRPPKVLVAAGIVSEGALYLIEKALYGLAESPQDWGAERDQRFRGLTWKNLQAQCFGLEQARSDHSLWKIREVRDGAFVGSTRGLLGVYVDDLLLTAEAELADGLLKAVTTTWKCSEPQSLGQEVVFCGLQIRAEGQTYLLSQSKYMRELQQRHPDIKPGRSLPGFRDEEPAPDAPVLSEVREAQKYLGELQWLACRSRPDISFAVSRSSRLVARNPLYAVKSARQIMSYLFSTADLQLRYGNVPTHPDLASEVPYERSMSLVEAFSDASFGCEDGRSQSGVAVLLGGCMVAWLSIPQPFTTLSTCEAELVSACEALTLSQSIIPLWQELVELEPRWVVITDSVSAASVLLYPAGSWRTRHLRLRCRAYQEMIEEEQLTLAHVKGQYQVADLLTKALSPPRVSQLLEYLGCITPPCQESEKPPDSVKAVATGSNSPRGRAKSLVVLSCLLGPVHAQPNEGLRVGECGAWIVWAVILFFALALIGYAVLADERRLERLRDKAKLVLIEKEGVDNDVLEPWEEGEHEVLDPPASSKEEVETSLFEGERALRDNQIPMAKSTVGQPPSLRGSSVSKAKNPFYKAPPSILNPSSVKAPFKKAPPPPPPLERSTSTPGAPTYMPKMPVKRPPLLPTSRFFAAASTSRSDIGNSPDDRAVVHTPPRQQSSELPPLLSYEELIQRAMRRELNREPTAEEVEEEIRQMAIRNSRIALGSSGSDSYGSHLSSDTEDSDGIPVQPEASVVNSSGFTYLPPTPTPIIRLVAPRASGGASSHGTVWEAERVDGGRVIPTTVRGPPEVVRPRDGMLMTKSGSQKSSMLPLLVS